MTAYRKTKTDKPTVIPDIKNAGFVAKLYYDNLPENETRSKYSRLMTTKIPFDEIEASDLTLNQWELKHLLFLCLNELHACRAIFFYQNVRKGETGTGKNDLVMFKIYVEAGEMMFGFEKSYSRRNGEPNKRMIFSEDNSDCFTWHKWFNEQDEWTDGGKAIALLQKVIKEYKEPMEKKPKIFKM